MDSTELREKLKNGRYVIGKPPAMGCFLCRCGYDYYISSKPSACFCYKCGAHIEDKLLEYYNEYVVATKKHQERKAALRKEFKNDIIESYGLTQYHNVSGIFAFARDHTANDEELIDFIEQLVDLI